MADWFHIGPVMTAAFLASLVEAIEALTIVLAVTILHRETRLSIGCSSDASGLPPARAVR